LVAPLCYTALMGEKPHNAEPGRFQFSLRTLLLWVTLAGVGCFVAKGCAEYLNHPILPMPKDEP